MDAAYELYTVIRDRVFCQAGSDAYLACVMGRLCKDMHATVKAKLPPGPLRLAEDVPLEDFQAAVQRALLAHGDADERGRSRLAFRILVAVLRSGSVAHLRWALDNVRPKKSRRARHGLLLKAIRLGDVAKADAVLDAYGITTNRNCFYNAVLSGNVAMADWVWGTLWSCEHYEEDDGVECPNVVAEAVTRCDYPMLDWLLAKGAALESARLESARR